MLLIIITIIVVMTFISISINHKKNIKIYFSEDYIYTKDIYEHDDEVTSKLPYVNIKGDDVKEINIQLINSYYKIIKSEKEYIQYDYFRNNDIISLIVKYFGLDSFDSYPKLLIYNFDIKNGRVLSNTDLFDLLSVSEKDVSSAIEDGLKVYYDYEIERGYYTGNFESYLYDIAGMPILDGCHYYVTNDGLYVYKEVVLNAEFFYDIDSNFKFFHFKIK